MHRYLRKGTWSGNTGREDGDKAHAACDMFAGACAMRLKWVNRYACRRVIYVDGRPAVQLPGWAGATITWALMGGDRCTLEVCWIVLTHVHVSNDYVAIMKYNSYVVVVFLPTLYSELECEGRA